MWPKKRFMKDFNTKVQDTGKQKRRNNNNVEKP